MKKYLSDSVRQASTLAVIYIIFGFIMCFFGRGIIMSAARILGLIVMLYGIYQLYLYFGQKFSATPVSLIYGLACAILGLIAAARPGFIVSFIPKIIGIIAVFNGAIQVQRSMMLKDSGYSGWLFNAIVAVVMILGGLYLFFRPFSIINIVLRGCGIFLIVEGVFMLLQSGETKKYL